MPTRLLTLPTILVLTFCGTVAAQEPPATLPATRPAVDPVAVTQIAVRAVLAGDADPFAAVAAPKVRKLVTPDKLRLLGRSLTVKYGRFEGFGDAAVAPAGEASQVTLPALFERQAVIFVATVGADGLVGGLVITGLAPRGKAVPLPAYADPAAYAETDVVVRTPRGDAAAIELPGTLAVPNGDGPFPAVVLVHGSGPSDRDGTVGGTQIFRDLAAGLASRGVAVLRYDKRTYAAPQSVDLAKDSLDDETVRDAVSALELLRSTPRVDADRLFVLGHSLGGMLGPRIVAEDGGRVAGLVLASAPARPAMDLLVGQLDFLSRLDGKITPDEQEQLDAAVAATVAVRSGNGGDGQLLGTPLTYWKQLDAVRPTDDLAAAFTADPELRVLLVDGGRDYQVTAADWAAWLAATAGDGRVVSRRYPALNHLLVPGDGPPGPAEYARPGHVAGDVVTDVAAWVKTATLPPPTTRPAERDEGMSAED